MSGLEKEEVQGASINNWVNAGDGAQKQQVAEGGEEGLNNLGKRFGLFFSEVSVVGVKYVALSGAMHVRKAIWLVCVLCGLGFMIYQFYDRITYFLSNPTSVKIAVTSEGELIFPTITICNENVVYKEKADTLGDFTGLITKMYPPWPDSSFVPQFDKLELVEESLGIQWSGTWRVVSPFLDETLWSNCEYNGRSCNLSEINIVPTEMGYCLEFNGDNVNYTIREAGSHYGLWMMVNISQGNYVYARSRSAGVRIAVHDKHELAAMSQYSIKAGPGQLTSIGLKKKVTVDLPSPYSNCSDDETYSSYKCHRECLEEYVIENCGCREFYYMATDPPTCNPQEMYECSDPHVSEFLKNNLADELCSCPQQCEKSQYLYTISSSSTSELSAEYFAHEALRANCSSTNDTCTYDKQALEDLTAKTKRDILEFEVYFQDLTVEEIKTQPAYTILALLCDIGGALGLILGATVLTLMELLDFAIILLYDWIRYHITERNNKRQTLVK